MNKYRVKEAVKFATNSPFFGTVVCSFDEGVHEPKSEQEELALKALVSKGLAEEQRESRPKKSGGPEAKED